MLTVCSALIIVFDAMDLIWFMISLYSMFYKIPVLYPMQNFLKSSLYTMDNKNPL